MRLNVYEHANVSSTAESEENLSKIFSFVIYVCVCVLWIRLSGLVLHTRFGYFFGFTSFVLFVLLLFRSTSLSTRKHGLRVF